MQLFIILDVVTIQSAPLQVFPSVRSTFIPKRPSNVNNYLHIFHFFLFSAALNQVSLSSSRDHPIHLNAGAQNSIGGAASRLHQSTGRDGFRGDTAMMSTPRHTEQQKDPISFSAYPSCILHHGRVATPSAVGNLWSVSVLMLFEHESCSRKTIKSHRVIRDRNMLTAGACSALHRLIGLLWFPTPSCTVYASLFRKHP